MDKQKINQILEFWFGQLDEQGLVDEKHQSRWFAKDPNFDLEIKNQFLADINRAKQGVYDDWLQEPRGRLAAILLIDQFCRNAFRGQPEAFAADHLALEWALKGIELKHDRDLPLIYRIFFYLPLEHSEDLSMQKKSVIMFQALLKQAPAAQKKLYKEALKYAELHADIIERFGRFPHRNQILGRKTTKAEAEFLMGPNSSF